MKIKWMLYTGSKKRHAFPVDEKKYGDWSICGRGSLCDKFEGIDPLCEKCLYLMGKHSTEELEFKRMAQKRQTDFYKEHGQ